MSQRKTNKSGRNLSQRDQDIVVNSDEIINNVVRYLIMKGGEHTCFTKYELTRNVIPKACKFDEILAKVKDILNNIYGYNILMCDPLKGKEKNYIVTNTLSYTDIPDIENTEEIPDDSNSILLLLILSHIFMSNNSVTDVSLYNFLKSLQIDIDMTHPIFGKVKEYIHKTLVKKQYLHCETDNTTKTLIFKWGIRSEKEISKKSILEFVCKIYKDMKPKDWSSQFKNASQQSYEEENETQIVQD